MTDIIEKFIKVIKVKGGKEILNQLEEFHDKFNSKTIQAELDEN